MYKGKSYRLFSFWDNTDGKTTLIIATHGIMKKTTKTPKKEIRKAEETRRQYFNNKQASISKDKKQNQKKVDQRDE